MISEGFNNNGRILGIDLLRLLSMFFIVSLHVLSGSGGGGVLTYTEPFSVNWFIAWIWETIALQAVNCFAIISGFITCEKKISTGKYVQFWLYIFIMNIFIYIITLALKWHTLSIIQILKKSIPWNADLWYVKAYLGLILIMPALNLVIDKYWNKYELYIVCSLIAFLPLIYKADIFPVANGYSTVWLSLLYMVGGGMRKGKKDIRIQWLLIGELSFSALSMISKVIPEFVSYLKNGDFSPYTDYFQYNSPFVVCQAICTTLLFIKIKQTKKTMNMVSSAILGVYVIHKNDIINGRFVANISNTYGQLTSFEMLYKLFGNIILIFGVSLIVSILLTPLCNFFSEKMIRFLSSGVNNVSNLLRNIEHKMADKK